MLHNIIKILVSAVLIFFISEISKRSSTIGSILASIPLVSFLAFIWMYAETKNVEQISSLSKSIFWMVIPSLSFFITLPILLSKQINFYLSMLISTAIMVSLYFLMIFILSKFGVKL